MVVETYAIYSIKNRSFEEIYPVLPLPSQFPRMPRQQLTAAMASTSAPNSRQAGF
jgi:hypothetical protein